MVVAPSQEHLLKKLYAINHIDFSGITHMQEFFTVPVKKDA